MSLAPPEAPRWTPRQWLYLGGLIFFLHAAAIWFFGERLARPPRPASFPTAIYWAIDPSSAHSMANLPVLRDPTLFVLPNLHDFSGAAWLKFTAPPSQVRDWAEPPRWLELQPARLAEFFARALATNTVPPLLIADKPVPELIGSEPSAASEPPAAESALKVLGGLAHRAVALAGPLPAWPHNELLNHTTIQVLVDEFGWVISATLLESCRLKAADDYALNAARQARFQPLVPDPRQPSRAGPVGFGKLVFQWRTLAPSAASPATVQGAAGGPR